MGIQLFLRNEVALELEFPRDVPSRSRADAKKSRGGLKVFLESGIHEWVDAFFFQKAESDFFKKHGALASQEFFERVVPTLGYFRAVNVRRRRLAELGRKVETFFFRG